MQPFDPTHIAAYHDLKKLVGKDVFLATMTYIAWHNRLTMTPLLTVRQAIVLALYYETHPSDPLLFTAIKRFWEETANEPNTSFEACRQQAETLARLLHPSTDRS